MDFCISRGWGYEYRYLEFWFWVFFSLLLEFVSERLWIWNTEVVKPVLTCLQGQCFDALHALCHAPDFFWFFLLLFSMYCTVKLVGGMKAAVN